MSAPTLSLGDAAARGAGVTLVGQVLRTAMQFGSVVILARLLSPADFGLVAMVAAIVGISEIFRDFGLSSAAIQAKTVSEGERTNLFWANTALGVGSTVVMAALAPLIVLIYDEPRLGPIVLVMACSFTFSGIATQFRADMSRHLRFMALTQIDLISVAFGLVAGVVFALLGFGYWAIVFQQLGIVVSLSLLCALLGRWWPGLPRRSVSIRRFMRYGGGLLGTQTISYVTKNVDSVALGMTWGASTLGLYDRGYQLLMTPLNQINAPLTRVALPILSKVVDDPVIFRRYLDKSQLVGCYVTATVLAVAAGLASPLVAVLFGPRWMGIVPIFICLAIGGMFRATAQLSYWMFLAAGKTGAQLRMFLVLRPIMVVIILAGLPWGAVGVAIGQSIAYALHWGVSLWRAGVVTETPSLGLALNALKIMGIAGAPAGLAAAAATFLPLNPVLQLVVGVGFAAAYLFLIVLVVPSARRDGRVVLRFARRVVAR